MGKKHETKYHVGDRINDRFTLLRNYSKPSLVKGKNVWLWDCVCDCGNVFHSREHVLKLRYGCHSCTNKKTSTETAIRKKKGIEHYGLKNRLYKDYRVGAERRNIEFDLTFEEFVNLLEGNCVYCGANPELHEYELQYMQKTIPPWKHNGIDRVDTKEGYKKGNVVSCCSKCNYAKHDLSVEEFKELINKIYDHFILGKESEKVETEEKMPKSFVDYPQFNKLRNAKKEENI